MPGPIEVRVDKDIAHLRLARPETLNAMSFEMFEALPEAVAEIERSDARVCIVSGEGRSFCSGIDISDLGSQSGTPEQLIRTAQAGFRRLSGSTIPTIAAIHGHALGAGLQLAIACDIRVVSADARLGLLEVRYGIIPDLGGSTGLPRLVGSGLAKKMIWTKEQISGRRAGEVGLAEVVIEDAEPLDAAVDLARQIAAAAPLPVRESKQLIERSWTLGVEEGFDAEAEGQARCMTDPGFAEAMMAGIREVMEKRGRSAPEG